MNYKIENLKEKIKQLELDGMIVSNKNNIKYLLDVNAEGVLLITDKENIFITDARYLEEVHNIITINDEINVCDRASISESEYLAFFADCEKVGIEENDITYAEYINFKRIYRLKEVVETNKLIEKTRMIKDKEETEKIRKACEITDKCFSHLLEFIKVGMTEREIAFEIERFFMQNGADGLAFETIVASGENSSKPHTIPTDRKVQKKDVIVIDMGAKYKGYASDMTRTIFVGDVPEEIKELYNFVLACQERVTNKIKDGADGKQIAMSLESEFNAKNYGLMHALGHGVGLEVHEAPILSPNCSYTLKENMILTNEPGIYIPGKVGIRIEDTILVNKMTSEVLTKSKKEMIII